MKKLLPIILFSALFFLFSANFILAADPNPSPSVCNTPIVPCGNDPANPCQLCHLFVMFNNLIQFLLFCIVPPLAVAGIVVAGIFFIFSRGNPGTVTKAKGIIEAVLIGLFIIFTAWLLINLFFTYLKVEAWTGLGTWFKIECN